MILDGKKVSQLLLKNMQQEVERFSVKPKVVDILIGNNDASKLYVQNKRKACEKVGIIFEEFNFSENATEKDILACIKKLNNDKSVDAILVQLPLPNKFNAKIIINTINPSKDVDGLTDYNQLRLFCNENAIIPCTPKGILKLLKSYNISLYDKNVVLLGRGDLVGKPLLPLLLKENANVMICHSKTSDLMKYTKNADILICATNVPNLIFKEMVKEDSVVIDTGIFYDIKTCKIYGNVRPEVEEKVKYITPVPGGIGPMTVAMFIENVLICYKKNHLYSIYPLLYKYTP